MLTFLDMINHSLGYFNVNSKLKNQIYTVVGFVGDFYLLYVTVRLFQNGVWLRGILFAFAFLALMYAVAMNFIYYFTNKTTKLDPSPKIEKLLGGRRVGEREQEKKVGPEIPANGLFTNDNILPADVAINNHEQANLRKVVKQLIDNNLLVADYSHLSEKEIVNDEEEPVPALNSGQTVPYFELVQIGSRLEIYVGMNQMERLAVGHLASVGLTTIETAQKNYQLFLANVFIEGGPVKMSGRSKNALKRDQPYTLSVKVAYKTKSQAQK